MRYPGLWVFVLLALLWSLLTGGDGADPRAPAQTFTVRHLATLRGHHTGVTALAFSSDGKTLASGDWGGTLRLWNIPSGKLRLTVEGSGTLPSHIAFSPDGRKVAIINGGLHVLETRTGKQLRAWEHSDALSAVVFGPEGKTLFLASMTMDPPPSFRFHGEVLVWDLAKAKVIKRVPIAEGPVYALDLSPDGQTLAVGTGDGKPGRLASSGTLMLLDTSSLKVKKSVQAHASWVQAVKFSPDGKTIATGSANPDRTVKVWEAATLREHFQFQGYENNVHSLSFDRDSKTLATADSQAVKVWDVVKGRELAPQSRKEFTAQGYVAFAPQGGILATGGRDDVGKIWRVILPRSK